MKRIVLATALIAMSAVGVSAQTSTVQISSAIAAKVSALVPGADVSNLTVSQYARLVGLFAENDNLRAGNNPAGAVKVILSAQ